MATDDGLIGAIARVIDAITPDPGARDAAKMRLLELQGTPAMVAATAQIADIVAAARPVDRWTSRARPGFLYVMYALLLWSIPVGLIAAVWPATGAAIARGMAAYLNGIPESLYALFGTGYLGYTVARQWGKATGVDR